MTERAETRERFELEKVVSWGSGGCAEESAQTHRARVCSLLTRASDTTLRLPGTNLLDEWIGDLPLIAEVVAIQFAKIACPTGRQYIENRFQRQSASPGP